jgi:hypothetical protein
VVEVNTPRYGYLLFSSGNAPVPGATQQQCGACTPDGVDQREDSVLLLLLSFRRSGTNDDGIGAAPVGTRPHGVHTNRNTVHEVRECVVTRAHRQSLGQKTRTKDPAGSDPLGSRNGYISAAGGRRTRRFYSGGGGTISIGTRGAGDDPRTSRDRETAGQRHLGPGTRPTRDARAATMFPNICTGTEHAYLMNADMESRVRKERERKIRSE